MSNEEEARATIKEAKDLAADILDHFKDREKIVIIMAINCILRSFSALDRDCFHLFRAALDDVEDELREAGHANRH